MKHVNVIFSLRVDSRFHFNNMFVMPHVPCKFILAFWLTLDTSVMDHLSFQTLKCNYVFFFFIRHVYTAHSISAG